MAAAQDDLLDDLRHSFDARGDKPEPAPNGETLIVYGDPPATTHFKGGLTDKNRKSFEDFLRRELGGLVGQKVGTAKAVYVQTLGDVEAALKRGKFARVIYYGHAFTFNDKVSLDPGGGSHSRTMGQGPRKRERDVDTDRRLQFSVVRGGRKLGHASCRGAPFRSHGHYRR